MNIFKKIYCRSFQTVFKIALPFLPYRKPKIVSALSDIPSVLNKKKKSCPIIITDPGIAKLGDRKSTRLNSSHANESRMPSSA